MLPASTSPKKRSTTAKTPSAQTSAVQMSSPVRPSVSPNWTATSAARSA
jgi:hypothetical protein